MPLAELQLGDLLRVLPGERIPTDALIVEGASHLDESMLTGESLPVAREAGDKVTGGSINGEGLLLLARARRRCGNPAGADRAAGRIRAGQEGADPALVDRVSAVFVPVVLAAALVTLLGWGFGAGDWVAATLHAVSVLVIACPCALGLATPATFMVGTGLAARRGILVRDAQALEQMRAVKLVAFDKTGTLTEGKPRLQTIEAGGRHIDRNAAGLRGGTATRQRTPAGPRRAASGQRPPAATCPRPRSCAPSPAAASKARCRVGGCAWAARVGVTNSARSPPARCKPAPMSCSAGLQPGLADGRRSAWRRRHTVMGLLAFGDPPKAGAAAAIARLRALGLRSALISGDNRGAAMSVAQQLGIDEVHAEVLPADKAAVLVAAARHAAGRRSGGHGR